MHHPYGFNGKEENEELGLDWSDFGARNYDASLGRWMNIDPLAEKYTSISPYTYTLNNPVIYTDPDGMRVEWGDNLSSEEKQLLGSLITKLRRSSKTFDKVFGNLHSSKNVYKVGGKGASGDELSASFEPEFGSPTEEYDDDGELIGADYEETNRPGGQINLASSFAVNELNGSKSAQIFLVGQIAEEFSHAYQWESMNPYDSEGDETSFGLSFGMRGNLDYEFEAKAVTGRIFNESGTSISDVDSSNRMVYKFGTGYNKRSFNLKTYYKDMKSWKNSSTIPSEYQKRPIGNKPPTILLKLIK